METPATPCIQITEEEQHHGWVQIVSPSVQTTAIIQRPGAQIICIFDIEVI